MENNHKGLSPTVISDITDGVAYRQLCQPNQFLHDLTNLSGIFNTDGVQLYKSTGSKLWPIFIAVNELPPNERFARESIILAGIWQGKGNPLSNSLCHHLEM